MKASRVLPGGILLIAQDYGPKHFTSLHMEMRWPEFPSMRQHTSTITVHRKPTTEAEAAELLGLITPREAGRLARDHAARCARATVAYQEANRTKTTATVEPVPEWRGEVK